MEKFSKKPLELAGRSLVVATHSGVFHCDDVYAIALMSILSKDFGFEFEVIRTRDPKEIEKADIRIDVGGVYNEDALSFDHHQRDDKLIQANGIKFASFGLLCKWAFTAEIFEEMSKTIIYGIDYCDNTGKIHPEYPNKGLWVKDWQPLYKEAVDLDARFLELTKRAEEDIRRSMAQAVSSLQAEADFEEAKEELFDGKVVYLKDKFPISQEKHPEIIYLLNKEYDFYSLFKFSQGNEFQPEAWRGKEGEALSQASGIEGGIFCHLNGFLSKWKTKEAAIEAARISLKNLGKL